MFIEAKNEIEAFERLLDKITESQKKQVNKIRMVMLADRSEECLNCGLVYVPVGVTYTYEGEALCPCCDADIIDSHKARLQGYNKGRM